MGDCTDEQFMFTTMSITMEWLRERKSNYNQQIQMKIYKLANLYEEITYDIAKSKKGERDGKAKDKVLV